MKKTSLKRNYRKQKYQHGKTPFPSIYYIWKNGLKRICIQIGVSFPSSHFQYFWAKRKNLEIGGSFASLAFFFDKKMHQKDVRLPKIAYKKQKWIIVKDVTFTDFFYIFD